MIIQGTIVPGLGEGKLLGFPTANLQLTPASERAPIGIYAAWINIDKRSSQAGILVSGIYMENGNLSRQEVYVLDFNGDLYGKELVVEVVQKIRDVVSMVDIGGLKKMITNDIEKTRIILRLDRRLRESDN